MTDMTGWPRQSPASNLVHGLLVFLPVMLLIAIALSKEAGMIDMPRPSRWALPGAGLYFFLAGTFGAIIATSAYLFLVFLPSRFWLMLAAGVMGMGFVFLLDWWIETVFANRHGVSSLFYPGFLVLGSLANGIITGCRTALRRQDAMAQPGYTLEEPPIAWFGFTRLFSTTLVLSLALVALGQIPWRRVGPWIDSIMGS